MQRRCMAWQAGTHFRRNTSMNEDSNSRENCCVNERSTSDQRSAAHAVHKNVHPCICRCCLRTAASAAGGFPTCSGTDNRTQWLISRCKRRRCTLKPFSSRHCFWHIWQYHRSFCNPLACGKQGQTISKHEANQPTLIRLPIAFGVKKPPSLGMVYSNVPYSLRKHDTGGQKRDRTPRSTRADPRDPRRSAPRQQTPHHCEQAHHPLQAATQGRDKEWRRTACAKPAASTQHTSITYLCLRQMRMNEATPTRSGSAEFLVRVCTVKAG